MKNISTHLFSASALLAAMMSLAACDEIAEKDRLVYVAPAEVSRAVLIEDFTGQYCTNCPKATDAIHEIQQLYGESHVIAVAIHCGKFGFAGSSKQVGLMTDLGKEYWNKWFTDGQGQPVAKINRGAATNDYPNWSSDVSDALVKSSKVELWSEVTYDATTREAVVTAYGMAPAGYKANLQLWVVEDSIVAMQRQPDGKFNYQYVHNHVLRDAINGSWGEPITFEESTTRWPRNYTLPESYVAENCSVVAFVYDDNGVQQVCKRPLIDK